MDTPVTARPNIDLTPVESSRLAAIGHDPDTNTLAVQFNSKSGPGKVYHYANVSAEQFSDFQSADSVGKYFGSNILGNEAHPFTLLESE